MKRRTIVIIAVIWMMIITAFVIFLIPHIGDWMIERITLLRYLVGDFIRS
jgi:hypothetical protein